jgi:hypothetical protein
VHCSGLRLVAFPHGHQSAAEKKELSEEQREQLREMARARFGQNGRRWLRLMEWFFVRLSGTCDLYVR